MHASQQVGLIAWDREAFFFFGEKTGKHLHEQVASRCGSPATVQVQPSKHVRQWQTGKPMQLDFLLHVQTATDLHFENCNV